MGYIRTDSHKGKHELVENPTLDEVRRVIDALDMQGLGSIEVVFNQGTGRLFIMSTTSERVCIFLSNYLAGGYLLDKTQPNDKFVDIYVYQPIQASLSETVTRDVAAKVAFYALAHDAIPQDYEWGYAF